jgi:anti-anti-sigma factor
MPEQLSQSVFAHTTFTNGVLAVKLAGPSVGQREVPIITDQVTAAIAPYAAAVRWLVLDMSDVTFINSMGLGMCIDFRNRVTKSGAKAALVGMNQQLLDLFKMVKVDRLFTILKDGKDMARTIAS